MPTNLTIPSEIDLAEFISKEAHDLRSPFNRILGFVKLVLKGLDGPITDQARDDLNTVQQNSLNAFAFVNGLIDIARLNRGEKGMELASLPVNSLLEQAVGDWKKQYSKGIPPGVKITAPACTIQADEILFRLCLSNWISYATEFVLENIQIQIQVEARPSDCLFTVRSSGKKVQAPPACDLTIYGYVAKKTLELQKGALLRLEQEAQGAAVEFSWPT